MLELVPVTRGSRGVPWLNLLFCKMCFYVFVCYPFIVDFISETVMPRYLSVVTL